MLRGQVSLTLGAAGDGRCDVAGDARPEDGLPGPALGALDALVGRVELPENVLALASWDEETLAMEDEAVVGAEALHHVLI